VAVSETHRTPPPTATGQRAQSREIRTGGPVCPRANQHSSFSTGYRWRLGRISRPADRKIRCFWPKTPNSSNTYGPRGRPGGSLSARNSIGLRENNECRFITALVDLSDADVARPEFIFCRRTAWSSARSDDKQLNVVCCLPDSTNLFRPGRNLRLRR
jgi:hypothetical protein